MFLKIILFIFGIILTIVGFSSLFLYLNLLTMGYTFLEYVNFIISKVEFLCLPIGLIIIFILIFKGGKNEICIRHNS